MKRLYKSAVVIACLGSLAACAPPKNNPDSRQEEVRLGTTLDAQSVFNDTKMSPAQKSEKLAQIAEQLMTPTGFIYADKVLDQALAVDANNKRAQFYKALAANPMVMRGILTRIKPMTQSTEASKRSYDEIVNGIPQSPLKTFLLDGQEDLRDENALQAFLTQVYSAQNQFRTFLKENKSLELTLKPTSVSALRTETQNLADCSVKEISPGVYDVLQCGLATSSEVPLNRANIEILQQMTAGLQIYFATLIAYDVSGSIATAEKFRGQTVSRETIYNDLIQNRAFGTVKSGSALADILAMGIDAVAGARWALQFNNELCNANRPANPDGSVFGRDCSEPLKNESANLEAILRTVDLALSGQSVLAKVGRQQTETQVRPAEFFRNPIADLKTLAPTFNRCDRLSSVEDAPLAAIFPNDDINAILQVDATCP